MLPWSLFHRSKYKLTSFGWLYLRSVRSSIAHRVLNISCIVIQVIFVWKSPILSRLLGVWSLLLVPSIQARFHFLNTILLSQVVLA